VTGGRRETDEYRAFIRAHHPDRGGDPAEFAAGLAALRARRAADSRCSDSRCADSRCADSRYDAPVVGGSGPPGVADRLRRWYLRRYRKPRVR
jgi:hypothetical protein